MKMLSLLWVSFKTCFKRANAVPHGPGDGKELHQSVGQNDIDAGEEDESPFEFQALEVALEAICSFLATRTTELETDAYPALDELTSKVPQVQPGTSARTLLPMLTFQNLSQGPPSSLLQVAVKNSQQPVWYFNHKAPLHVFFTEDGRMERGNFLEAD